MQTIASEAPAHAELIVIDVGANVGDTIAVIEEHLENVCHYLCIEPDPNLAAILRLNYPDCNRVQILESFIGDEEGALVRLETDARGISSTRLLSGEIAPEPGTQGRLVSLDTAALPFAQSLDRLDLIKIDTEGFDFAVLRSGSQLLRQYRPCLFLEWYPLLLEQLHEEVWRGFEYLNELGYSEFVFFTNSGELHCRVTQPNRLLLTSLASSTYTNGSVPYFDVVASTSAALCDRLVELHSCNSGS